MTQPQATNTGKPLWGLILWAFVALVAIGSPRVSPAQWGGMKTVVTAEARVEPAEARRGETVRLIVTANVDPEYHLYAMKQPPSEDQFGPIPTEVTFGEEVAALLSPLGEWQEPEITSKFDQGFQRDVNMLYGEKLEFTREYTIPVDATPGRHEIAGSIYHQACTEVSCLPPADAPFQFVLTVLDGEPVEPATPPPATAQTNGDARSSSETLVGDATFLRFLLGAFLLGLAALATPCVFPMIPITISFFTSKSSQSPLRAAKYAGIYVFSIILGFTLIGFGISLLLLLFGAGVENSGFAQAIAANPWVNLAFAALYIFFALALFEVVTIQMPQFISMRMNQGAGTRTDWFGIFMKAQVFVVISFTCTAPLLGVLIVQTLTGGDWTRPLFGMTAFATGFALPFFLLALAPQMLSSLPRAGSWLYATKVVMGLIVLAAAFKFISNVDLILLGEQMLLTREVLLAIWTAIAVVITFYLFGFIRLAEEGATEGIGVPRLMLGTTFGTLSLYLATGLFGTALHPFIEAYMPPDLRPSTAVASAGSNGETGSAKLTWHEEMEPAIAEARRTGKNIFIDFTGYTCTNCRLMEKQMFPRPAVQELLSEYVRVKIYTDDRQKGAERQKFQAEIAGTVALPLYLVVTPDLEVLAKEEYTTDEARYVNFLRRGLPTGKAISSL